MEKELTGEERRCELLNILKNSNLPVSGAELGKRVGVSRQVVVQDIALLRSKGIDITSTARGYILNMLNDSDMATRVIKVCHTSEQVAEELNIIVDNGGCVADVMVNHRAYGKVRAGLNIKNRCDVKKFVEELESGKSTPLLNVTSGYHFHTIMADSEEVLDEIENELAEKGFLAEVLPYEKVN